MPDPWGRLERQQAIEQRKTFAHPILSGRALAGYEAALAEAVRLLRSPTTPLGEIQDFLKRYALDSETP